MSDEEVVVTEEDAPEEEVIGGSTDQGPYTGQSMDIPEVPFNPAAGMTATEVNEKIAENQNAQAEAQAAGRSGAEGDVEVVPDEE
jgi:hypothetical protein